jgi:hypothetical protein
VIDRTDAQRRRVWRTRLAVAIDGSGTAAGVCGLSVLVVQHHSAAALGAILAGRLVAVAAAWAWTLRVHRRANAAIGRFAAWVWAMVISNFLLVVAAAGDARVLYLVVLYAAASSFNAIAGMQATGRGVRDIVAIGPAGGLGLAVGGVAVGWCYHAFGTGGVVCACAVLLFIQLVEIPLIGRTPLVVESRTRRVPFEPVLAGLCLGFVAFPPLALYYGIVTKTLGAAWVAPAALTYAVFGLLAPVTERRLRHKMSWVWLFSLMLFLNALHLLLSGGGWLMLVDRALSAVAAWLLQGYVSREVHEKNGLGGVYALGIGVSVGVSVGAALYGAVVSSYGIGGATALMVGLSVLIGAPVTRIIGRREAPRAADVAL